MGPMLAPWTLLSGTLSNTIRGHLYVENRCLHVSSSLFWSYCRMRWSDLWHHMAFGDTRHDTNNMANVMVTYSLRRVCGGRTATLVPQIVQRPYGFYAKRTATSRFSTRSKVIASPTFFLTWHYTFFRNRNPTTPQPHRKVTVRWPCDGRAVAYVFLPCLVCLENRTAVSRRPWGGLTAPLRRPYGKLVVAARTVRVPYGRRTGGSRAPCRHLTVFDFKNRTIAVVAVTSVTTTTVVRKTLRLFGNHVLQIIDRRAVRRPYGGSRICDRGMRQHLLGSSFAIRIVPIRLSPMWIHYWSIPGECLGHESCAMTWAFIT